MTTGANEQGNGGAGAGTGAGGGSGGAGGGQGQENQGGGATGREVNVSLNTGGDGQGQGQQQGQGQGQGANGGSGQGAGSDKGKTEGAGAGAGDANIWGEKWREGYAGEDKSKLNVLSRYNSPKEALDAMFTARTDLQKLLDKQAPGKDATAEQVASYRKAQGIPEKPEGYFDLLDKGMVFGEPDKNVIMGYLNAAHARNASPAEIKETLQIYHQAQTQAVQALQENDTKVMKETEAVLRKEYGGEFTSVMDHFQNFVKASFPEEIHEMLLNARLGDAAQTPLMLHPAFIRSMASMARQLNPMGTNTSAGGLDKIDAIEDQIAAYKKEMGTNAWYKDNKKQEHYRQLVSARDRLRGNGK